MPWLVAFWMASFTLPASALPGFDEVKRDFRPSESLLLDRHGETIHRLRTDATVRRGQWVALADVSPALRTALVLSEDRRFYEHSGVDWRAVSAAAWGNLWNTRTRGASTISMQLAGLLDGDWTAAPGGRSVVQKLGQSVAAQVLDRRWRKDQILEAYLNTVPFRGELVGIDALSRTLFGKAPHGLDEREAAVAAALLRAPNAPARQVARRACGLLSEMQTARPGSCERMDLFATTALQQRDFDASEGIAPHVARRMLRADGPTRLVSTLSGPLQRFAVAAVRRHMAELQGRNVEDAALVVLDNASGEVLAWVGSSGEFSRAEDVDGVTAARQPGSTLKPFLYAQAIAERRLTAASLLDDSPAQLATGSGLYIPQNYDRQFKGWMSVRTALGASLNVPAVRTLVMVSPDAFARQLRSLDLPLKEHGDYYGYSLALGSAELPLLALTNAYRALANGGRVSETRLTPAAGAQPAASKQALDPQAAFIVGDILSDSNARARTFGTDSVLATRFWTAVKTGTSKDMRDNWALGWSQRYTVGVWVGNAGGAPMWDVSGTSGAAPIWAAVMGYLHQKQPSRPPSAPVGLVSMRTAFDRQLEATRDEWYLKGSEQPLVAINSAARNDHPVRIAGTFGSENAALGVLRIATPAPGTILALDPDIPPNHQRLRLATTGGGGQWRIDGKPMARSSKADGSASWSPWPGRHTVQLLDAAGVVQDEVRVEVRGAGVRLVQQK